MHLVDELDAPILEADSCEVTTIPGIPYLGLSEPCVPVMEVIVTGKETFSCSAIDNTHQGKRGPMVKTGSYGRGNGSNQTMGYARRNSIRLLVAVLAGPFFAWMSALNHLDC